MKIETKFNPEDKVWVMEENKPVEKTVYIVKITLTRKYPLEIHYELRDNIFAPQSRDYVERLVFPSKEALLDSFR